LPLGHDNELGISHRSILSFSKLSTVKTAVRVRRIHSEKQLKKAYSIRTRVFVKEQGVPEEIELDHDDKRALHFLAFVAGKAVGTARVVIRHGNAKIGRMAVSRSYRGKGVGTRLLKQAIRTAKQQNAKTIYLHAQVSVIGFYEAMNFRCVGPVFNEAGIPHRKMLLINR
jgi:predicted GNAT family N-acyltransferase